MLKRRPAVAEGLDLGSGQHDSGLEQDARAEIRIPVGPLLQIHQQGQILTGDGERFLEGANLQIDVDRRREVRRQLDAFADHRGEAGRCGAHPAFHASFHPSGRRHFIALLDC